MGVKDLVKSIDREAPCCMTFVMFDYLSVKSEYIYGSFHCRGIGGLTQARKDFSAQSAVRNS
jgi:hypothetical protein